VTCSAVCSTSTDKLHERVCAPFRFRVNMLSAISNAGMLRFRLVVGSFNGPVFIDFLRRLLRDCGGRRVHLIVDGHSVHRAKRVSSWVGRHAEQIELHFLPG
jgi:hypothetical protein